MAETARGARLAGRVALVTGSGQGIGRGIALALAKEGAALALVGRTLSKVQAVAEETRSHGASAIAIGCDVGVRSQIDDAVSATVREHGRLDLLVNNAQSWARKSIEHTTDDDVELAWRSGALATLYGMQAALPHLKSSGGLVINFGSPAALTGESQYGAYAMAKEAIRALSRVAAREWGPHGVRVNVIVPMAMSPLAEQMRDEQPDRFEAMVATAPLRRLGDPEVDIGRAVVALAAGDLGFVTGATLMLDGGRLLLP